MDFNNHPILLISFLSLILSLSSHAQTLAPSPSPAPISSISSSPAQSPAPISHISSSPDASPAQSPAPISQISSSPDSSPATSPAPISYISSSPDASPAPAPEPISQISSSPASSPAKSPAPASKGHLSFVLGSFVKKGTADAEASLDFLTKRSTDPSVSQLEAECIDQCVDNYSSILDDFKTAQESLLTGNFYMLNEDLSSVSEDIDACQDCFKEMIGGVSPIAKFEKSIRAAASGGLSALEPTS